VPVFVLHFRRNFSSFKFRPISRFTSRDGGLGFFLSLALRAKGLNLTRDAIIRPIQEANQQ
jgi:hypothetical protein